MRDAGSCCISVLFFHWYSLCGGSIYFVLTVAFYICLSLIISIGTSYVFSNPSCRHRRVKSIWAKFSHHPYGGYLWYSPTVMARHKISRVTSAGIHVCTTYYSVLSYFNFYVRVVTSRLLHFVILQFKTLNQLSCSR